jgi:CheY-like chemotaxis protein
MSPTSLPGAESAKDRGPAVQSGHILLVEDNQDNRDVLTVMLGERYCVWSYGSAAEALSALETVSPDLLVLDIGMKPVNGLDCLRAIRAIRRYSTIPAIALTGYAREVDRAEFLAGGFQAVVTKPILDYGDLEMLIDTLLGSAFTAPSSEMSRGNGSSHRNRILTDAADERMMLGRGTAA